jgi:inner membrane protein involved in colicin E2 resistance
MNKDQIIDAFFIGFLLGIILYSVFANTWGLVTLIPLLMIRSLIKKASRKDSKIEDNVQP